MVPPTPIHRGKTPPRVHYIAEWAERRDVSQADIGRAVGADKATVSRWFKGTIPTPEYLIALVGFLDVEDVSALFRHPDDDWLARFLRGRDKEERERIKATLETAFPRRKAS